MDIAAAIVRYNSSTTGRDKTCRLMQYLAKFLWNHLRDTAACNNVIIQRIKKFEELISTSRKTFRLGKSLDMLQAAARGSKLSDPFVKACVVVGKLCHAVYFMYDMCNWACRVALIEGSSKVWSVRGAPYWFLAVLFSLLRNIYDIYKSIVATNTKKRNDRCKEFDSQPNFSIGQCLAEDPPLTIDLMKNCCDLMIPLNAWGKVSISGSTIGKLGVVSSICGALTVFCPTLKY